MKFRVFLKVVKNMPDTSNDKCQCGCDSWKEHWEKNKGKKFNKCANLICSENAVHGGHVIKVNKVKTAPKSENIAPLCETCNNYTNNKEFEVNANDLVPPIGLSTCR